MTITIVLIALKLLYLVFNNTIIHIQYNNTDESMKQLNKTEIKLGCNF